MEPDVSELARRLEPYPALREALGEGWVREQATVDPVLSRYRLARWLRIDGFEPDLAGLDAVLGQLAAVPGIADRRRRLRLDPLGLMETLTELYFGAWLLDRGYRFDWPRAGADFAIDLGGKQTLPAEATTPRKAVWVEDLFDRLHLISRRMGFTAAVDHRLERLPDPTLSDHVVDRVVRETLDALARRPTGPITQAYPDAGLTITWTHDPHPHVGATTSPGPTSPYWGWSYVVDAAREKARQLPEDQAGVLVVGTRQMPTLAWEHFLDALRYWRPEDLALDWSLLPPQVGFVVLWSFVLRRVQPWSGIYLHNPASPFAVRPEVAAFFQREFSGPLRPPEGS